MNFTDRDGRPIRPQVRVYTRHAASCDRKKEKDGCPKWFYITPGPDPNRKPLRKSVHPPTTSWTTAEERAREFEYNHDPARKPAEQPVSRKLVADALDAFITAKTNAKGEENDGNDSVARKQRTLKKKLVRFLTEYNRDLEPGKKILYVDQITTGWLEEVWRPKWTVKTYWSKAKFRENVVTFFQFSEKRRWVEHNPAKGLEPPKRNKETVVPTPPFSDAQMETILRACSKLDASYKTRNRQSVNGKGRRLRTLITLMRWAGPRISDASLAERSALGVDNIWRFTALKNHKSVNVELPPDVAEELRSLPVTNSRYFFWSGEGKKQNAADVWQKALTRLWKLLDPPLVIMDKKTGERVDPHSHMFRNTFAVKCRIAGLSWENIASLLGDDVGTVKEHYAPYTHELETEINRQLRKTWTVAAQTIQSDTAPGARA